MKVDVQQEARGLIKGKILFNAPMSRYTSMKVGGVADVLLFPRDVGELRKVVRQGQKKSIPMMIVGKGTNLIVRDQGIRGWVINLTKGMNDCRFSGDRVEAESGLSLRQLVGFAYEKGLSGLEPFHGIPGTVGGGLAMNAGAWGAELKQRVLSVTFMREDGSIVERLRSNLRFHYRGLVFPASWVVLKGRFQLTRGDRKEIRRRMREYGQLRSRNQPLEFSSAGSVFKNPKNGPAGKLIEEAGLRGAQCGQARVSDRHANFIVNLGGALAEDVIRLMEQMEKKVFEETGIVLEREVKVVGH